MSAYVCIVVGLGTAGSATCMTVHWVKVPEDKKFHIGHFPVNFWRVPLDESPGSPRTFSEFYALPVTGPDSLVKVAFHNGLADCDPATLVRDDLPGDLEKIKVIIAQSNIWG